MTHLHRSLATLALLAFATVRPVYADPLNGGLDLGTSTSGSYEARNVLIQPAALGFETELNGPSFMSSIAIGTHTTERDDYALALAYGGLGFGAERFGAAGMSRFQFALGAPLTSAFFAGIRFGLNRWDSGPSTDTWDLGFQYRPSRYFSLGALIQGFNQPVYLGAAQPFVTVLSTTVRPTQSIDLTFDISTPANAFFQTHTSQAAIGVRIADGIRLRLGYHTNYQWLGGLQIHFGNASIFSTVAPTALRKLIVGFQSGTSPYTTVVAPPKRVRLAVGGHLSDEKTSGGLLVAGRPSLLDLLKDLEEVRRDNSIEGLVLRLDSFPLGLASAHEFHDALLRVKAAGKSIDVYLADAGIKEYFIASAANRVYIEPSGEIRWLGLRSERYYLKGTLDKIGAEGEFLAAGKYKSAPEMFTRKESSETARTASAEERKALEATLIDLLAKARKIDRAKWRQMLDLGLISADEAHKNGLVDGIASYSTAVDDRNASDWILPVVKRRSEALRLPERVGVVVAAGNILPNRARWLSLAGESAITPGAMGEKLKAAREDSRTRAIVLRIASPGGEVLASQQIATVLENTREVKPLFVSMGDVAASGGYYIAAPAAKIFAGPMTVTGSIGVFLGKFNMAGLFKHIDLRKEVQTEGPYPGLYSEDRPWTKQERLVMERRLTGYYDSFLTYVSRTRRLDKAKVGEVAQGRVWTGKQAIENGLADSPGGYFEAIEYAAQSAGLRPGEYEAFEIETDNGLFGFSGDGIWGSTLSKQAWEPWRLLLSEKAMQDLVWLSTLRHSPFLYMSPTAPPDA